MANKTNNKQQTTNSISKLIAASLAATDKNAAVVAQFNSIA